MRGVAAILLAVAALIWCSQAVRKGERRTGNDLVGYLDASRALYAGGDPYHLPDRFPYIYPLFLATAIRPLGALPRPAASVTWFAIQAACLWCVLSIVARSVDVGQKDLPVLAAAIVAVFGDVLQNEFVNGQVNLIVLALAVVAVHVGSRRPRVAALLLGCAIALKLTPALIVLYWVVERRYRLAAESVVWAILLMVSPWMVAGARLWPMYATYGREFILARTGAIDTRSEAIFFTPYGFWEWVTGLAPGRSTIIVAAAVIACALAAWHARVRQRGRAEERTAAWVYAAAIPLLSPMSEVHHLTNLIPAAVVGAVAAWRRDSRFVTAAAAVFVVAIWVARFDRTGPWYFLSVVSLITSAVLSLRAVDPSGTASLNSGASEASAGRRWGWGPSATKEC